MEIADPEFYEECALRKKWSYLVKDPSKAIKEQHLNNYYWTTLNHSPKKEVKKIVTDRVLKLDQQTCQNIISRILEDKKGEEAKKAKQLQHRTELRSSLQSRHNKTLELEKKIN